MVNKKRIIARDWYKHLYKQLLKVQGNVCKHCDFAYWYRVPQNPAQKLSTVRNIVYREYFTYTIFTNDMLAPNLILLTADTDNLRAMTVSEYKVLHALLTISRAENGEITLANTKENFQLR